MYNEDDDNNARLETKPTRTFDPALIQRCIDACYKKCATGTGSVRARTVSINDQKLRKWLRQFVEATLEEAYPLKDPETEFRPLPAVKFDNRPAGDRWAYRRR
jgi:hypothetical protein